MTVTIPQDFASFVSDEVASGRFRSTEELFSEALTLLRDRESHWKQLQADIAEGLEAAEAGMVRDFDPDEIKSRGRARLASNASRSAAELATNIATM